MPSMEHIKTAIFAALVKAQSQFPTIERSVEVDTGKYKYKFAPYSAVCDAIKQPLSENGLAFTHLLTKIGDQERLETHLFHESGESIETSMPVPSIASPQQFGGWLSYMKRYQLSALLGLATDDDVDAQDYDAAPQIVPAEVASTVAWFMQKAAELEIDPTKTLPFVADDASVTRIEDFPPHLYGKLQRAVEVIELKKQAEGDASTD